MVHPAQSQHDVTLPLVHVITRLRHVVRCWLGRGFGTCLSRNGIPTIRIILIRPVVHALTVYLTPFGRVR